MLTSPARFLLAGWRQEGVGGGGEGKGSVSLLLPWFIYSGGDWGSGMDPGGVGQVNITLTEQVRSAPNLPSSSH